MPSWNTLPGETPLPDSSGLKIRGLTSRKALNAAEAENIRRAIVKYLAGKPTLRRAPFDVRWFLKLHIEMFGQVWTWAGVLRRSELNIGIPASQVESALYALEADLRHWVGNPSIPLLDQSVYLHHRAVAIHPFLNGNGRWARLLANIWLRRHGHPLTRWPEETVGQESILRQDYLTAIRAADLGNFQMLRALHQTYSK